MNKKKSIPGWVQNRFLIRVMRSDVGIILSYWLFQGMLYMDIRETTFKVILDAFFILFFSSIGIPLIISLILAHTINMLLNGHYFVMKHNMGRVSNNPQKIIGYLADFSLRLQKLTFLDGAAAYGSISRNLIKPTSDIDMRVFPEKGFISWAKAVLWVFKERTRALFLAIPLDIYAFDLDVIDSKMRPDESPIIFYDPGGRLVEKYREHLLFKDFARKFKESYIPQN